MSALLPPRVILAADPAADLAVSVTSNPNPGLEGESVTYTITVRNNGPDTADQVRVIHNA